MKVQKMMILLLMFTTFTMYSQKNDYAVAAIADSLKENANAVVRLNEIDILISSQRSMYTKTKRVVTVLNIKGLTHIDAREDYDKKTTIKKIGATIYDKSGVEIKKIRQKDFRDQAAIDGVTIFSDSRFMYLNYTPIEYPFTVVYESEVETSNTAFIASWYPISDFFESTEKSILNVSFASDLGFKKKESNFSEFNINKIDGYMILN